MIQPTTTTKKRGRGQTEKLFFERRERLVVVPKKLFPSNIRKKSFHTTIVTLICGIVVMLHGASERASSSFAAIPTDEDAMSRHPRRVLLSY